MPDFREPVVAIIGAGFSGTLVLANLIAKAKGPLVIELFEKNLPAAGVAYGTPEAAHLLNVRAINMGAFAGKPGGFHDWLQTEEGRGQLAEFCQGKDIAPDSFLPRALYGVYLKRIYDNALAEASLKKIKVRVHPHEVVDAALHDEETQQLVLSVPANGAALEIVVDALVLATGNLPPHRLDFQSSLIRGVDHYVPNVWQLSRDEQFLAKAGQLSADSEIVIIGTGLTMIDSVQTLKKHGFKGTITAISRHGLLPSSHAPFKPYAKWEWVANTHYAPKSALGMLRRLRQEVRKAQEAGYDWRSVIDSLRPITQPLWQQLGVREKRRFLSRLFTLWNIHRHRMAPDIHAEIKALRQSGTLKILAGKIYYVGSDEDGLTVAYRKRGANRVETIRAALVLNCTGPEYDIATSTHRLLKNLRDRELITIGPLRIGIDLTPGSTARGKASESIFPLGTLLVGELLECTAVPELRDQADKTATIILKRLQSAMNEKPHVKPADKFMSLSI